MALISNPITHGTLSEEDNGFAYASEAISIESTDSGTEGNNEEPVPRYALRPQKKKHQLSVLVMAIPPVMKMKLYLVEGAFPVSILVDM